MLTIDEYFMTILSPAEHFIAATIHRRKQVFREALPLGFREKRDVFLGHADSPRFGLISRTFTVGCRAIVLKMSAPDSVRRRCSAPARTSCFGSSKISRRACAACHGAAIKGQK
jgi:hypothetical protein